MAVKYTRAKAPLSRRPYLTIAVLAVLTCALAVTIEMIQDAQLAEFRARASSVYRLHP